MKAPASIDYDEGIELQDALEIVLNDLLPDCDLAELVWWPLPRGGHQPVLWPMTLHVHDQECMRA